MLIGNPSELLIQGVETGCSFDVGLVSANGKNAEERS